MKNRTWVVAGLLILTACGGQGASTGAARLDGAAFADAPAQPGTGGQPGSGGQVGASTVTSSGGAAATGSTGGAGGAVGNGGTGGADAATVPADTRSDSAVDAAEVLRGTGGAGTGGQNAGGGMAGRASGGSTSALGGAAGAAGMVGNGGKTVVATGGNVAGAGGAMGTGGSGVTSGTGAPETKPLGYGQGTTGGGSAAAVSVDTMAALQAAIDAYSGSGGLNIRYIGKFDFAIIPDPCTQWNLAPQIVEIKKKNDITLLGADGSAANFGIHIASSASNIIVRNMTFGLLPGGDGADAISIEGMSGGVPTNIWIDHNELFSSMEDCAGAGDSSFDGLIDLKKGADNVTISYNHLHDHHKASLNGFSDSDTAVRHVTYHHNIFDNIGSRTPLQRGGYSHLLNNYFNKVETSGANIRMSGYSLIEGNYFENVHNPVTSRDSSAIGYWELRGNNITSPADFTKFGITWGTSSSTPSKDATDWTTTASFPEALGYAYSVDSVQCLKDGLSSVAGAGKGLATLKCK